MDNIDEMPAGREMDALVAVRVMGWYWGPVRDNDWKTKYYYLEKVTNELGSPSGAYWYINNENDWIEWAQIPHYSTDIAAAWKVVEKVMAVKRLIDCSLHGDIRGKWHVKFTINGQSFSESAPLAICRAALKALNSVMSSDNP